MMIGFSFPLSRALFARLPLPFFFSLPFLLFGQMLYQRPEQSLPDCAALVRRNSPYLEHAAQRPLDVLGGDDLGHRDDGVVGGDERAGWRAPGRAQDPSAVALVVAPHPAGGDKHVDGLRHVALPQSGGRLVLPRERERGQNPPPDLVAGGAAVLFRGRDNELELVRRHQDVKPSVAMNTGGNRAPTGLRLG